MINANWLFAGILLLILLAVAVMASLLSRLQKKSKALPRKRIEEIDSL